jgi:FAD/FMN-containing dehydrogenase
MAEQLLSRTQADELAAGFRGRVLTPGQDGYEEARKVWNGLIDRRPALIAQCAGPADVVAAVRFARETSLPVAVRGGGHSASGHSTCDDGIVIDLSQMRSIRVDPEARTARAEAGATWGDFDAETQAFGLAVTGGRFSTTGIAGLTLGSGSGWLERKCGLTPDNLIAADVVLADGRLVTASENSNPDLYWALRGGGGNFGIVTSFELRLHEVGPIVYGGLLMAPPERAGAILRFMREYMPDAPDDLGGAVAFVSAPPAPFVPQELHGQPIAGIVICWTGSMEEGERIVAPIREVAQPLVDVVGPMPYTALQSMLDGGGPHGIRAYMKAEFLPELSDEAIAKLAAGGARRPGAHVQLLLEPMGGAIARVDADATALGRRDIPWCFHALSMWVEPDAATADAHVAWARELAEDMRPHTVDGVYLNYTSDTGDERVRSSYGPEKYARLVAIKDEYDPANMFRLNQNIRPSVTVSGPAPASRS